MQQQGRSLQEMLVVAGNSLPQNFTERLMQIDLGLNPLRIYAMVPGELALLLVQKGVCTSEENPLEIATDLLAFLSKYLNNPNYHSFMGFDEYSLEILNQYSEDCFTSEPATFGAGKVWRNCTIHSYAHFITTVVIGDVFVEGNASGEIYMLPGKSLIVEGDNTLFRHNKSPQALMSLAKRNGAVQ